MIENIKVSKEHALAVLRIRPSKRSTIAAKIINCFFEHSAQHHRVSLWEDESNLNVEFTGLPWRFDIGLRTMDILHNNNRQNRLTVYHDEIKELFMLLKDLQGLG